MASKRRKSLKTIKNELRELKKELDNSAINTEKHRRLLAKFSALKYKLPRDEYWNFRIY